LRPDVNDEVVVANFERDYGWKVMNFYRYQLDNVSQVTYC
jgi:hypothetical protein